MYTHKDGLEALSGRREEKEKKSEIERHPFTYSMILQFPNGDIVRIPDPDPKDGWKFSYRKTACWPVEYVTQSSVRDFPDKFPFVEFDMGNSRYNTYSICHLEGWLIFMEYAYRISAQQPQIIDLAEWQRVDLRVHTPVKEAYTVKYSLLAKHLS